MEPLKYYEKVLENSLVNEKKYLNDHIRNKILWKFFFTRDFLWNFLILIIIRISLVGLSYLPPYFTDQYLRKLSIISENENEGLNYLENSKYVGNQTILIIFLLYFQGEYIFCHNKKKNINVFKFSLRIS